MRNLKQPLIGKDIRLVVTLGRGNWRTVVKSYKLPVLAQISTRNLTYSMRTTVRTAEWYTAKLLVVNSKSSHHKGKIDVKLTAIIISQHT